VVGEPVEGVGPLLVDDDARLVLLLDDGLGRRHQLPLQATGRHDTHAMKAGGRPREDLDGKIYCVPLLFFFLTL